MHDSLVIRIVSADIDDRRTRLVPATDASREFWHNVPCAADRPFAGIRAGATMTIEHSERQQAGLAADCRFLRRTIESGRLDGPLVTLCTHPIRDGFDCVGPFMEDLPTSCRLWEEATRPARRD
jgi:hypothetical protein